ncbi:hypothetical protein SNE40_021899 [Patella caerulea]|uniref:ABC transporter domain-containing protein n=1 Tax=Patella caerulea TaxID=87958 RepID=A0AAN8IXA5_PATCE
MANFLRQVTLLMWKNFLIQRRRICAALIEILSPTLLVLILVLMRSVTNNVSVTSPTIYAAETLRFNTSSSFLNDPRTLCYAPKNGIVDSIMETFINTLNEIVPFTQEKFKSEGFLTEDDMVEYYTYNPDNVTMGIIFDGITNATTDLPKTIAYTLRPKTGQYSSSWQTQYNVPFVQSGGPRTNSFSYPDYIGSNFVLYQAYLDQAIIQAWTPTANISHIEYKIQKMPYPEYIEDRMIIIVQTILPLLMCFSFIVNVFITVKSIIYEKERNLKESMKMMGLKISSNWAAWFLTTFIYLLGAIIIYTIVMAIPIGDNGRILRNSDLSVIFVFLLAYIISIISFCLLISAFFNKANIGAAAAGILYFGFYVPYFFISLDYPKTARSEKLGASLLFNTGMAIGSYAIGLYEGTGEGVQWNNIASPPTPDDNFSMLDAIVMLLGDSAIYLTIMWYVENVYPGKHGVPKPFYFPFTKSYWCGSASIGFSKTDGKIHDSDRFEKEPVGMRAGISISGLRKEFKTRGKKKLAVDNMNLNVYQGQITVLLGHNGAGKTTTMSMLTGFIPPTSGKATVNGHDIETDIDGARESLGLCPQHNILFDTLTVDEHLEFFLLLKGGNRATVEKEVATMAKEVGLETKRTTRSMNLSGGQKRKLSVGIALIGGSEVVILDEPTSGMDPAARRQTWDILQRYRSTRTILLTTHFMDEADLLGDRIAIMADGRVKCCGRSHFLKQIYGAGYHLIIVKSETCDVSVVTELVRTHIPSATLESEISAEISYLLPNEASPGFSSLFKDIEIKKNELGINSFGTTATTMEEVFLKSGEEMDKDEEVTFDNANYGSSLQNKSFQGDESLPATVAYQTNINVYDGDILAFNKGFKKVEGLKLEMYRFYAMFIKKAIHTWRNKLVTIVQFLIPVLSTIVAMAVASSTQTDNQEPSLTFDMNRFSNSITAYGVSVNSTETTELADKYGGLFGAGETTERLTQQQAQNFSTYFLDKAKELTTTVYNNRMVIGADFSVINDTITSIKGFYNGLPYHSSPISVSFMMNALARQVSGDDELQIITRNHPLPPDVKASTQDIANNSNNIGFTTAFCLMFGMCFLASSLSVFLIKERQVGAKHLQKVSGVGTLVYWLSNITWDFINYMMPCILIVIVFASFGNDEFVSGSNLSYVFLILFVYGIAIIPYVYMLQFLFKTPPGGMAAILILNVLSGIITVMAVFILRMPTMKTQDIADILDSVFSILFPQFNLGISFMNIVDNYHNLKLCAFSIPCDGIRFNPCCKDTCDDLCYYYSGDYLSLDRPGIGRNLLILAAHSFVFSVITLTIEAQLPQRIWYTIHNNPEEVEPLVNQYHANYDGSQTDSDVKNEVNRVKNMDLDQPKDSFILKNLYKRYGNFVAVDHISVGIPDRECFGLLGQNGAGKTTTFKMLTGDVMVTSGNAFLKSNDIKSSIQKVQENMGYCPQFDALIDQMTGEETLYLYGRLKGIPENRLKGVVNSLINTLMLKKHANKLTQEYSGGNKRKLSTALALIGDPGFILLDEPSSGIDPKARRQLWTVLSKVRDSGKTLILTSHSMEECDALCTRVAIMVNGSFKCLGSPQHLKNKYGRGYTLICRMKTNEDGVTSPIDPLVQFIKHNFPSAIVFDDHQGYAHFQIPDNNIPLAGVFDVMEESKGEYFVEDYSVHQTTLEQVFLAFAGKQIPPREDKTTYCKRICCC